MTVFFTSDTHFGHGSIVESCERPFSSLEEMDEALIARWNERVQPGDTVYHLGDVAYRNTKPASSYLDRLNGVIHLIAGNHDNQTLAEARSRFASVNLILEAKVDGQLIVMCHYPMREWHGAYRNAWHLFGHVHGRLDHEPLGLSMDVGADGHDFRPWTMEELHAEFEGRENPFLARRGTKPLLRKAAPSAET